MKQLIILILFLFSIATFAQELPPKETVTPAIDSLTNPINLVTSPPDTVPKATGLLPILFPKLWDGKKRFTGPFPIPKKALVMAFSIPGGGQIYNKKYWKLPIVYGLYGLIGYSLYDNTRKFRLYKEGYLAKLNGRPTIEEFENAQANVLLSFRNKHRKNIQLSAIGLLVGHALVGIDAFVDAHLYHFNVDEDLSMGIAPSFQYTMDEQFAPGVRVSLSLREDKVVFREF